MDTSDRSRINETRTRVRGVGVVLATAVALFGLAACVPSSLNPNTRFDNRRFDELQAAIGENPTSFEAAVARMEDLVEANPAADRIAWILRLSCVTVPGEPEECTDTSIEDQQRFGALPAPSTIVYQAKDGQRIFIRFHMNDPPMYYLMYAPDDTNPGAFAESRGFRSHRELNDGWSILGPISDGQSYKNQWLLSD